MKEISKILLMLTIFLGLAIGITTGMILNENINLAKNQLSNNMNQNDNLIDDSDNNLNNNLNGNDYVSNNQSNTSHTNIGVEYHQNVKDDTPGAELNGYYDENDLKWTKLNYQDEYMDVEYYQISGLKNKTIEKKINEKIKNSALKQAKIKNDSQIENKNKVTIKQYKLSSFANVISISNIDDNYIFTDNTYINIDLNTGEELKIEDLFTKDADILGIVRGAFYRLMGIPNENDVDPESGLYTEVDERALEKIIKKYKTTEDINFGFTPNTLFISINGYFAVIDMKAYHEDIAIYSRFLKNVSIYENDNVALEHLHYFSDINPENITKYAKIAIQKDNIVYDYIIVSYIDDEEVENKIIEDLNKKIENEIASLKNTLSEDEIVCFSGNFAIMKGVVSEDIGSMYNYSNYFDANKEMIFCRYSPDIYKMTRNYYDEVFYKYIENNYYAYFDNYGNGLYRTQVYDENMQWNQYYNCYYSDYNLVNEKTICYSMNGEYLNLKVNDDIFAYFLKEEYALEDLYRKMLKDYIDREQLEVTEEEFEQLYAKIRIDSWIHTYSNIELRLQNEKGSSSEYIGEVSVFYGSIPYFEYGYYRMYT